MFNRLIRAVFNRSALLGGAGPEPSLTCDYIPEHQLDDLPSIVAEAAVPWRVDASGQQWYRCPLGDFDDYDTEDTADD